MPLPFMSAGRAAAYLYGVLGKSGNLDLSELIPPAHIDHAVERLIHDASMLLGAAN
jgi:hypothetical protein